MRDELLKDKRVCEVRDLRVRGYRGDMRIEQTSALTQGEPGESQAVASHLKMRLESCFPEVKRRVSFHPGDGWQKAFHDDDRDGSGALSGNTRVVLPVSMSWNRFIRGSIAFALALGCLRRCPSQSSCRCQTSRRGHSELFRRARDRSSHRTSMKLRILHAMPRKEKC